MAIAIVGAGAIGGYLGARLANAGEDVVFIARGANLAALKAGGIRLLEEDGTTIEAANVRATDSMSEVGPQDVVLLTVKAHQVGPIAAELGHMIGPETYVVTMQNGIPWWYFMGGHGGRYCGTHLENRRPRPKHCRAPRPGTGDRQRRVSRGGLDRTGRDQGDRG